MDIDLSQFIHTMRFISATNKQIVANEKTRAFVGEKLIELQIASFHERARAQALSNKNSIAHAYTWEEITDGAGYFKVKPDTSSPLFRIVKNNRRAGSVFSIKFIDNKEKALRDKRIEAISSGPVADHHFKDQSAELERVAIIEKESSKISKRRISGASLSQKKRASKKRIIDLDPSGLKIINRTSVRRPNEFKNNFSEFFFNFFTFEGEEPPGYHKSSKLLIDNLAQIQRRQMAYAAHSRSGTSFSMGRRAGGATKVTARLTSTPIVVLNERGAPVGISGIKLDATPSNLAQVRKAVAKSYKGATLTGAVG
jgi:hypothetical protein